MDGQMDRQVDLSYRLGMAVQEAVEKNKDIFLFPARHCFSRMPVGRLSQ